MSSISTVFKNLLCMLEKRKCYNTDLVMYKKLFDSEYIKKIINEKEIDILFVRNDFLEVTYEIFIGNKDYLMRLSDIKQIIGKLIKCGNKFKSKNEKVYKLSFIIIGNLSISEKKKFSIINEFKIELFSLDEFLFNPLDNFLQPGDFELIPNNFKLTPLKKRIYKITDENKFSIESIEKKYKTSKMNFPLILSTDVISRYLGAKKGDVIAITRYQELSGISMYYRTVI